METSVGQALDGYGLNFALVRYAGMGLAGLVAIVAGLVVLGLPVRWMLRPLAWPVSLLRRRKAPRIV
jgi:hypothetical protein